MATKKTEKWNPDATADMVASAIDLDGGCIDEEVRTAESKEEAIRRLEDMIDDASAALICVRGPGAIFPKLDDRDLATILAALRLWQSNGPIVQSLPYEVHVALMDIASKEDSLEPLTALEVDALCERLNTGGA